MVYGTRIHLDYSLVPLLKGLKIGKILCELWEDVSLVVVPKGEPERKNTATRRIAFDTYEASEDTETEDIDGQEGYRFLREIEIPRCLRRCLQSVEACNIKIKHRLVFVVPLHNPDGHISEVSALVDFFFGSSY